VVEVVKQGLVEALSIEKPFKSSVQAVSLQDVVDSTTAVADVSISLSL